MFQIKSNQRNSICKIERGFTLIEIMVSISIFTVVVLITIGALVSINEANRKIQSMRALMDNLNFALENMSRTLRTGSTYHCGNTGTITSPQDCPTIGSDYIAIEGPGGSGANPNDQIVFSLSNGQIQKSTNSGSTFLGMTSPDITITTLQFYVSGAAALDAKQPKILLLVGGTARAGSKGLVSEFHLQTTISQRLVDS
ncbi:MAG: prepilin-type N-terminal cleavage/methylation domain-containing protein [Candidatus Lloydbacteria bacterium]|nr:prepilin-type N-terminal cleavage/methylation domain-containing protein [Candidatus Lloydbacteria bacterium]